MTIQISGDGGQFLVLGRQDVGALLTMEACIDLLRTAMVAALEPEARQPLRSFMSLPDRDEDGLGIMPGYLARPACFGAKVISVFPANFDHGLPSHRGGVMLFEPVRGRPLALMDAGEITAIRTAAASALATDLLANPQAGDLAILGYGEQAERHLESMAAVRRLRRVRIWGRSLERAQAFAARNAYRVGCEIETPQSVDAAIDGADLVCTTTAATTPILFGRQLQPGMHLNVVGSSKARDREVDDQVVVRSRFYVDLKISTMAQAGEFLSAMTAGLVDESHILGQVGELLNGTADGRQSPDDITVYKSLGINAQDLACATYLLERARADSRGAWIDF